MSLDQQTLGYALSHLKAAEASLKLAKHFTGGTDQFVNQALFETSAAVNVLIDDRKRAAEASLSKTT